MQITLPWPSPQSSASPSQSVTAVWWPLWPLWLIWVMWPLWPLWVMDPCWSSGTWHRRHAQLICLFQQQGRRQQNKYRVLRGENDCLKDQVKSVPVILLSLGQRGEDLGDEDQLLAALDHHHYHPHHHYLAARPARRTGRLRLLSSVRPVWAPPNLIKVALYLTLLL